jgi:cold shock protein
MISGTVKFFNTAKGFGFITPDGGGKDVFIPANSITSSGMPGLKAGQRVSFETEPDSKGPKAVKLKLLDEPPQPAPERPAPVARNAPSLRLTLFADPAFDESHAVLAAIRAAGHEPSIVDYIATPPTRDELRNLSLLLRDADQNLARRYDTLFLELQLDDRFISENEFWTAIVEHPTLINGPVLATANKARICRTEDAVNAFLGIEPPRGNLAANAPRGNPSAPATDAAASAVKKEPVQKAEHKSDVMADPAAPKTARAKPEAKAKPKAEPKVKIKTVAKAASKPRTAAKAKAVKKPTPKPAKKIRRAG